MIKVGVIGHTGRLGKPLIEILRKHPHAEVVYTESRQSRQEGKNRRLAESEIVILALPHGESRKHLSALKGKRLIDLSADHRADKGWVYGLPELNREKIRNAQKIANPGCYATSIILALAPLKGKISNLTISSTSGISGAGLETQEEDNFKVYNDKKGREHLQIAEIEKELGLKRILFVPQRIDTADRGIVSVIFGDCEDVNNLNGLYKNFYKKSPFVRLKKEIETKYVNHSNFCDIKVEMVDRKIIMISALDNLIKGGAGQAVQNLNLMYGLDETLGLSEPTP